MFFDGDVVSAKRNVSLRGSSKKEDRNDFLERTSAERRRREIFRLQTKAADDIQGFYRSKRILARLRSEERLIFDQEWQIISSRGSISLKALVPILRRLLFLFRHNVDESRLWPICHAVLAGLSSTDPENNFASLAFESSTRPLFVCQAKQLAAICVQLLNKRKLHPNDPKDPLGLPLQIVLNLVQTSSWTLKPPSSSVEELNIAFGQIINHLVRSNLYSVLREFLINNISNAATSPAALTAVSIIATRAFTVCPILDRHLNRLRPPTKSSKVPSAPTPASSSYQQCCLSFATNIASIPLLFLGLPDTAAKMLKRAPVFQGCITSLSTASPFVNTLPPPPALYGLDSSIWLLGNILELGGALLASCTPATMASYISVVSELLQASPLSTSQPHSGPEDADDIDSGDKMDTQTDALPPALNKQLAVLYSVEHVGSLVQSALPPASPDSHTSIDKASLYSLCTLLGIVLQRWRAFGQPMLNTLSFSTDCIRRLWAWITSPSGGASQLQIFSGIVSPSGGGSLMGPSVSFGLGAQAPTSEPGFAAVLSLFCRCFSHYLYSLDDHELYSSPRPFSLPELAIIAVTLKQTVFRMYWQVNQNITIDLGLRKLATNLLTQLYDRNSRRPFLDRDTFLSKEISTEKFVSEALSGWKSDSVVNDEGNRARTILRYIPFVVPFEARVQIFQEVIAMDKETVRASTPFPLAAPGSIVTIRRDYVFEDGFAGLNHLGEKLKQVVRVQFVNKLGVEEAGVDGGGVFKEFLNTLCKTVFDSRYGLFKSTSDNLLYPNPSSGVVTDDHLRHFEFLGRIVGKAIYENILVELPFANFFLSKLLGKHNFVNDLPSLDPDLYKHLMFLKTYQGNVEDLGLNFTIASNEFGETREIPLMPGGKDIPVTSENQIKYIYMVADYKLNRQIKAQCDAFLQGLRDIIQSDWLLMFSESELQILISGSQAAPDMEDLRNNCVYSGGYTDAHPTIRAMWDVVTGYDAEQRRAFLKFVTSCSRPPLLGFKYLQPAFCIQQATNDLDRLPTASTCMNLLKLPPYNSKYLIKQKLTYAIQSNAGFELS
mmetsp:Transcript_19502/g.32480  ORF Transcript_19502/g.32480 Transcript_19502/m.32480 type:complete len:1060 (+) Transcript_19502:112-3291(+)|eukprot:CAMPEP_0184659566 /NCGR_PEP_ID=MMETSP0308-20130426/30210_1 /TAXON_ID=38269 /ORGANISM="Gloeochaete witrockiana, Strain SAG 46.84" /LENGTH=1059 /DNA_ID=CAMNT_0027099497 /DNA_START=1 /DNA_END=3180 /DNA_ORIENTATION=-